MADVHGAEVFGQCLPAAAVAAGVADVHGAEIFGQRLPAAAAAAAAAGVAVFLSTAAPALWATPAIHTWLLDSP